MTKKVENKQNLIAKWVVYVEVQLNQSIFNYNKVNKKLKKSYITHNNKFN
jgi:hypothetical protein